MKKIFGIMLITILFPTMAVAGDLGMYSMRRQADSEYRIAQKEYRKAVKEYGENLDGIPDAQRASACKKIGFALHDNRTQYNMEDVLTQMQYHKQIKKLEMYNQVFGCTGGN